MKKLSKSIVDWVPLLSTSACHYQEWLMYILSVTQFKKVMINFHSEVFEKKGIILILDAFVITCK